MQSIKTKYATTPFRSRLEARYALLFDLCGIRWKYEDLDVQLSSGLYIPDFYLPLQKLIIEIKPFYPRESQIRRYQECAIVTGKMVILLYGGSPIDSECETFPQTAKVTFPTQPLVDSSQFTLWDRTRNRISPYNLSNNDKIIQRRNYWRKKRLGREDRDKIPWEEMEDPDRAWLYVDKYRNYWIKLCLQYCRNIHTAEDLYSEIVVFEAQRISSYFDEYKGYTYVSFMALNLRKCVQRGLKERKKAVPISLFSGMDSIPFTPEAEPEIPQNVELRDFFSLISPETAQFMQEYVSGKTQGQIAEENGKSRFYVNRKINAGVQTIRKKIS